MRAGYARERAKRATGVGRSVHKPVSWPVCGLDMTTSPRNTGTTLVDTTPGGQRAERVYSPHLVRGLQAKEARLGLDSGK